MSSYLGESQPCTTSKNPTIGNLLDEQITWVNRLDIAVEQLVCTLRKVDGTPMPDQALSKFSLEEVITANNFTLVTVVNRLQDLDKMLKDKLGEVAVL